ncbi:MAG TPA: Hpt domain-containing protein [Gammaproteobacteria bacterium]|nr:Hpt domain-containing protein [Gammaproteobacteria bacterium]
MMHEAVDYNALSWVRGEIDATLRRAHAVLVKYSSDMASEDLLSEYAELLHLVRGPLQIAGLAGADLLVSEMESLVSELQANVTLRRNSTLDVLLNSMNSLPVYISRLQSSSEDSPELLYPQVNLLRSIKDSVSEESGYPAGRDQVILPEGVYTGRVSSDPDEIVARARAARLQFQSALLGWYRGAAGKKAIDTLTDVLVRLQEDAGSEAEACLWWVAAGVAEALTAGLVDDSKEIKQLFGQIDRQIKRLVSDSDVDFGDAQAQCLLDGLLGCLSGVEVEDGRIAVIHETFFTRESGLEPLAVPLSGKEDDPVAAVQDSDPGAEAGDAVSNMAAGGQPWPDDPFKTQAAPEADARFQEILKGISLTKEAIEDYLSSSGGKEALKTVPSVLEGVCAGLGRIGLDRESGVISSVDAIIGSDMLESTEIPVDERLCKLADAICSVEFYIECLRDGRIFGSAIIESAEAIVASLGWPVKNVDRPAATLPEDTGDKTGARSDGKNNDAGLAPKPVTSMQVVGQDVDEEILGIFFDESATELQLLAELVASLDVVPVSVDVLEEISRIFHTLKGNSRMLGALSLGEFAYVVEDFVNNALKGSVAVDAGFIELLARSCQAMRQLVEQVKVPGSSPDMDIEALVADVVRMNCGVAAGAPTAGEAAETADDAEVVPEVVREETSSGSVVDFPVLVADADPEIVEIFIEEASEEIAGLVDIIPDWIAAPEQSGKLTDIRRSMHTLKGSGRMAGALLTGEFAWSLEDLLNRVIDGTVRADEALYSLMSQLPQALQELIAQVKDGTEPAVNIAALMEEARKLLDSKGDAPAHDETATESVSVAAVTPGSLELVPEQDNLEVPAIPEQDYSLVQIYSRECRDILGVIQQYLDSESVSGIVTEPLYRGLHTLSGISESADVGYIGVLASDLDKYFSSLYMTHCEVPAAALEVLRDCGEAIALQLEKLPYVPGDSDSIDALRYRIADLYNAGEQRVDNESARLHETLPEEGADITGCVEHDDAGEACQVDDFANVDQELFEVFLEESADIIDASERILHAWAASPEKHENLVEYQRHLHTMKGSARMMNITAIGDLSHSLETLLTRVVENTLSPSDELFSALFVAQDQLSEMLEQVKQHHMPDACNDLQVSLEQLLDHPADETTPDAGSGASKQEGMTAADCDRDEDWVDLNTEFRETPDLQDPEPSLPESSGTTVPAQEDAVAGASERPTPELPPTDDGPDVFPENAVRVPEPPVPVECPVPLRDSGDLRPAKRKKPVHKRGEQVKVQSELLDDLVNYAGEINIYRSRMETQIGDYRFNLGELEQTINRLRDQLRKLEIETEAQVLYRHAQEPDGKNQDFDPLELDRYSVMQESSRSLMESISDLCSLHALMENTTRDAETLLLQQSRVSTDLHEGLMHTRMTPFAGLETRLKRIVRQSARQLDKKVDLVLHGADGEMDRAVIEHIIAPLEHMLRNSVAHGIETPDDRVSKGKEETGTINIAFGREGPDIILRISDDGAGMNVDAIREKAVEKGLLAADAEMADSDISQFVLQTGFSTASEVTQISGRGVGLDVVNSEVKQLGGSLHIESVRGAGTVFAIRLPYTLAINHALLVKAGTDTYCVPLGNVEGVVRVQPEALLAAYATGDQVYEYAGNKYQLKHLATLLNTDQLDADHMSSRIPLLLMRVAEKRIALHVESLLGSREIVIKPVGVQLNSIDGLSGATILGDGSVAMILDVFALSRINARANMPVMRMVSRDEKRLVVMVVDDSITVRKVTSRLLERNGYKVLTAKDGVDATGQLQGCTPDIMLLDIEMPRMDGFELATHMRNDERLRHVPLIMITSRTGDKHRERARQIGVKYYLGKPYQENDLLGTIDQIIRVSPAVTA